MGGSNLTAKEKYQQFQSQIPATKPRYDAQGNIALSPSLQAEDAAATSLEQKYKRDTTPSLYGTNK